jgi:asparagine synthase (glutamine-hydrolysing)
MCGIAGAFEYRGAAGDAGASDGSRSSHSNHSNVASTATASRAARVARVAAMTRTLVHRGPDAEGFAAGERHALGFRRLAILDLSAAGNQPHAARDGRILTLLNGEIYNYRALREELIAAGVELHSTGDAEVLPHLYARHGDAFLERLEGMFALAVLDLDRSRLLLARDRFGKKPLYFRRVRDEIEFASEPRAFVAAGMAPQPDPAAIVRYLCFGYVPAGGSAFAGLERLRAGERLIADAKGIAIDRWYAPPAAEPGAAHRPRRDLEGAKRELLDLLTVATRDRLESDVPLGVFLSGGIDSGLVLAAAARAAGTPPLAFTIGFDDPALDERDLARATARHLEARWIEHVANPRAGEALEAIAAAFDEPFGDSSAYPTLLVSQIARREVTVALSGDGGDESFAGYRRHRAIGVAASLERMLPRGVRRVLAARLGEAGNGVAGRSTLGQLRRFAAALALETPQRNAYWSTFFVAPLRARFLHEDLLAAAADPEDEAARAFLAARGTPLRRALEVDLDRYLPDDLLVKTDIASMAHSLEVRSPWLDRRIVEFARSLPDDLLLRDGTSKHLARELAKDLLPPAVAAARKRGFGVPLAAWLRGPLKGVVRERLLSSRFTARRILKIGAAEELLARHERGEDWSSYLWLVLVLDAWYRRFID